MKISKTIAIFFSVFALLVLSCEQVHAEPKAGEWLRGTGKDLEICLKGDVVDANGKPVPDAQVKILVDGEESDIELEAVLDEGRFEAWIPLNKIDWSLVRISATSKKNDRAAYLNISTSKIRQLALDGIKLKLEATSREFEVKVVEKGKPVSNATVEAHLEHIAKLRARTDAEGIARFHILPNMKLSQIGAWTEDRRVGGYQFHQKPLRDPQSNQHVIELNKCHDLKINFVDEIGAPVPDLKFLIEVSTGYPTYNYIPFGDNSRLTTDAKGEAVFRYFPDWPNPHFYVENKTPGWFLDGELKKEHDSVTYKVRKGKQRKSVSGRVATHLTSCGGFHVEAATYQSEEEHRVDRVNAFTDSDGNFTIDVLPDATYCACVDDARWIGNMIGVLTYNSKEDKVTPVNLSVFEGQDVEITATTGPKRLPFANLQIYFRRNCHYDWMENGLKITGVGTHDRFAETDANGKAIVRTLPGEIEVSVNTPIWRTSQTLTVKEGKPTAIQLHREVEKKVTVAGKLILDGKSAASLANAEIQVGSIDGKSDDEQTAKSNADGTFSFDILASEIGIFARTTDGLAAGVMKTADLNKPVILKLKPTGNFAGQLLGKNDQPIVGKYISAVIRIDGTRNRVFFPEPSAAMTDEKGNFTLAGLPIETKLRLSALAVLDSGRDRDRSLGDIYLEPNDSRPRTVLRTVNKNKPQSEPLTLADRFKTTLRDCKLSGYRMMLIITDGKTESASFARGNFSSTDLNADAYLFVPLIVTANEVKRNTATAEFLKDHQWELQAQRRVSVYALDKEGKEVERLELNSLGTNSSAKVSDFIRKNLPPKVDAEVKWTEAFAEAKRTNRRVWVRVSQRYDEPCFEFTRWLDDQSKLLEKEYVMLKIDDLHDQNGKSVVERLTRGKSYDDPFHAIFNNDEKLVIDSVGPLGNIGNAGGIEGLRHLRKMITTTRQKLTDEEIDQIIESKNE